MAAGRYKEALVITNSILIFGVRFLTSSDHVAGGGAVREEGL